jgi:hypothetical protein
MLLFSSHLPSAPSVPKWPATFQSALQLGLLAPSLHRRLMHQSLARFLPERYGELESEVPFQAEDIQFPVIRP